MKTETAVYDLEAEDQASLTRIINPAMSIERGSDFEAEAFIKQLDQELSMVCEFSEKKKMYLILCRKANQARSAKAIHKFFYYSLLREVQNSEARIEKAFYLALIRENLLRIKMDGEFKLAYVQALILLFELEKTSDLAVVLLELIASLSRECYFDNESRYEVISVMHAKLFHSDAKIKKNALSVIISLTKHIESEFLVVFEIMLERCLESQNKDLALIFLQTLADLDFVVFSAKISKMIVDIISNPIFQHSKECLTYLLKFLERVVLSFTSINAELSKCIFVFLCKNMRNLHKEIRKQSIDVFCKMELRQVGEEFLSSSIQKEKFEDYQSRKKGHLGGSSLQTIQNKKLKVVENYTEKIVNQVEIKSNNDNVVIGCIHHVLEDELPEVRIAAIKAIETLGKILTVEKTQDIKELLLYFLNDDFDRVRIKALQSLSILFNEISLSDFELDTIYFNLKENLYELRIAIYKMLANFSPKKSSQIIKILHRLLDNIKLYREDAPWIYKTIKKIFEKNKRFHLEVLNELLFVDSANLIQEKDFKDPESVVRIILLSNALRHNSSLIDRYPHYFKKHVILLKELYPNLIDDIDNDDNSTLVSMKNSIIGEDTLRTFIKCLNEQIRGKENFRLSKIFKNFTGQSLSHLDSKSLDMFAFCDRLIRSIKSLKMEVNMILPDKHRIIDTLLKIIYARQSLRISSNLKRFLTYCETFFWMEYLYCKVRKGQLKRRINSARIASIITSIYDSASVLSKDDQTGQFAKLVQILQPLLNTLTHTMLLTNGSLLTLLGGFIVEFNIQEFAFYAEDFIQIMTDRALLHSRETENEIIEVVPRYPFNFKLYVEAEIQVIEVKSDGRSVILGHQGVRRNSVTCPTQLEELDHHQRGQNREDTRRSLLSSQKTNRRHART